MTIGKAGNPDIMDNVDIIIGATTDVISAEGKILTVAASTHTFTLSIQNNHKSL